MTEEIIINGVDVAGCCKCYNVEQKIFCGASGICANNPNCYYKQLKHLEQENKELKETVKDLNQSIQNCNIQRTKMYKALEEILESAKFAQCLPCGSGNLEDCLNCDDDTTNNGQFCMEKRIHEIKTKCVEVLNHSEG